VAVETAIAVVTGAVTAEAVVTGAIENKRFSLKIDLDQKPSARLFVQEAFLLLGNQSPNLSISGFSYSPSSAGYLKTFSNFPDCLAKAQIRLSPAGIVLGTSL